MSEKQDDKKTNNTPASKPNDPVSSATAPVAGQAAAISQTDTAAKKADPPKNKADKNRPASDRRGRGFLWFVVIVALLIAMAAAALAGWMYREQYMLPAPEDGRFDDLRRDMVTVRAESQQQLGSLRDALEAQREVMSQLRSDYQQTAVTLNRQQQRMTEQLAALSTVDRADWLLAEAEYLLRLANQRAQLNRDPAAAAKLLGSADQILRDLDDPSLHPVRAALAEEVASLKAMADLDVEGTYLRLEGLISAVSQLHFFEAPRYQPEPAAGNETDDWQTRLRSGLDKAWQKLRSYIRVRHHDDNFKAVLAPEQEAALRAGLRLMLEQAQLALLAERGALFQRSLDKARDALQRYYVLDEGRNAAIAEIASLQQLQVEQQIVDISASLKALKDYADTRRWQREAAR